MSQKIGANRSDQSDYVLLVFLILLQVCLTFSIHLQLLLETLGKLVLLY